ncbi:AAA family ATPase [Paenibacillus sp. S-38]|uniref:AAA family ATPase n=1 Tax=Paenibacillus sp. S-38 TaxID=3416710 RepID=UPI003CE7EB34
MSYESIIAKADESIANKNYITAVPTTYYILTIKIDDHHYVVRIVSSGEIVGSYDVRGKLADAKKEGVLKFFDQFPAAANSDVTMMHYKWDRRSGNPWAKESDYKDLTLLLPSSYTQYSLHQGDQAIMNTNTQNLILYGPPGTGKTYHSINHALSILDPDIDPDLLANPSRRSEAVTLFNRYVESNHVMFCTFHQSYGYEEFVEGIRFSETDQKYEVRDGVFKKLCDAARVSVKQRKTTYQFDPQQTQFFKMSLGNTRDNDDEIYDYCISNNVIALGWGGSADYSSCVEKQQIRDLYYHQNPDGTPFGVEALERFKHWMRIGDVVVISSGNHKARAIGKITGEYTYKSEREIEYQHFRSVEWLYVSDSNMLPVQSILRDKVFSQQTIYMFYSKDLNMESLQELLSGQPQQSSRESQYVLIIDEINRGNISKIFGELITLMEPDKREGRMNEMSVTLPYSGKRFSVPANVHLLGTMNTADRSIALLDTALRRRFDFVEMMPDYVVLPTDVGGVNIQLLLKTLNDRIEYLYDRDHVIGHAYFITDKPEIDRYIRVMTDKVIPLLQEYFYDSWESIELILGGTSSSSSDRSYLLHKKTIKAEGLFGKAMRVSETQKVRYFVQERPTAEALIRIYKNIDMTGQQDEQT